MDGKSSKYAPLWDNKLWMSGAYIRVAHPKPVLLLVTSVGISTSVFSCFFTTNDMPIKDRIQKTTTFCYTYKDTCHNQCRASRHWRLRREIWRCASACSARGELHPHKTRPALACIPWSVGSRPLRHIWVDRRSVSYTRWQAFVTFSRTCLGQRFHVYVSRFVQLLCYTRDQFLFRLMMTSS